MPPALIPEGENAPSGAWDRPVATEGTFGAGLEIAMGIGLLSFVGDFCGGALGLKIPGEKIFKSSLEKQY